MIKKLLPSVQIVLCVLLLLLSLVVFFGFAFSQFSYSGLHLEKISLGPRLTYNALAFAFSLLIALCEIVLWKRNVPWKYLRISVVGKHLAIVIYESISFLSMVLTSHLGDRVHWEEFLWFLFYAVCFALPCVLHVIVYRKSKSVS